MTVPVPLLRCDPYPEPPGAGAMQSDVAIWATRLKSAYDDCREKLRAIEELQAEPPKPAVP